MESRIFLIGYMGSGKTTLGSKLARKLGYAFADMDREIEQTADMKIPQIFEDFGEPLFRQWEEKILEELGHRERIVISTGGGAPCHGKVMQRIRELGSSIYIQMPPEALKDRLIASYNRRPLIEGKSEKELLSYISETLEKRESYYLQADYIVDGINIRVEQIIEALEHQ